MKDETADQLSNQPQASTINHQTKQAILAPQEPFTVAPALGWVNSVIVQLDRHVLGSGARGHAVAGRALIPAHEAEHALRASRVRHHIKQHTSQLSNKNGILVLLNGGPPVAACEACGRQVKGGLVLAVVIFASCQQGLKACEP